LAASEAGSSGLSPSAVKPSPTLSAYSRGARDRPLGRQRRSTEAGESAAAASAEDPVEQALDPSSHRVVPSHGLKPFSVSLGTSVAARLLAALCSRFSRTACSRGRFDAVCGVGVIPRFV
jgi:hypothetical protein